MQVTYYLSKHILLHIAAYPLKKKIQYAVTVQSTVKIKGKEFRLRMNVLVVLTGGPGRPSTPGNPASPFLPWRNIEDNLS